MPKLKTSNETFWISFKRSEEKGTLESNSNVGVKSVCNYAAVQIRL